MCYFENWNWNLKLFPEFHKEKLVAMTERSDFVKCGWILFDNVGNETRVIQRITEFKVGTLWHSFVTSWLFYSQFNLLHISQNYI
jgi:hypothetical protein